MTTFADRLKAFRAKRGATITIDGLVSGTTAAVTIEGLALTEVPDWIPDSARNAANNDSCLVRMSPADFATPPIENQTFTRTDTGVQYIIGRLIQPTVDDVIHSFDCLCYRVPVMGTGAEDDAQLAQWQLPT